MTRNMVSPNTVPLFVNGSTYSTAAPGLVILNVPEIDAQALLAAGWHDAALMTNISGIAQRARAIPIDDVAGNFTAANYAGVFPVKNIEDALAQLAARLTAGHL
jgi:hypothetical protein